MFHRERFEQEYFPIYQQPYNIGTTIWSPLASGLLTGKYNEEIPAGSRAASTGYAWLQDRVEQWRKEGKIEKVRQLTDFAAKRFNCSASQLAIAWCAYNQRVSTVLLGATKPSQLTENLGALKVLQQMTPEDMKKIDEILGNAPSAYGGYGGSGMRSILNKLGSDK